MILWFLYLSCFTNQTKRWFITLHFTIYISWERHRPKWNSIDFGVPISSLETLLCLDASYSRVERKIFIAISSACYIMRKECHPCRHHWKIVQNPEFTNDKESYYICHHFRASILLASSFAIDAKLSAPLCSSSVRLLILWQMVQEKESTGCTVFPKQQ